MVVQVKICGLCRPEDAAVAWEAGATHVGVILVPGSRREQTVERALEIYGAAGDAQRVGVFADASVARIGEVAEALELDVVQLHGGASPEQVGMVGEAGAWTVWKVLRPRSAGEVSSGLAAYADVVDGILVDGYAAGEKGGSGVLADWSLLGGVRSRLPEGVLFGLAGGLGPENVAAAIRAATPDLVDVSSGVESTLCRKDAGLVAAFVRVARGTNA